MLMIIESSWGTNVDVRDVVVGAIGRKLEKSFQREGPGKRSYKHGQLSLKGTPTAWWRAYSESLGVP